MENRLAFETIIVKLGILYHFPIIQYAYYHPVKFLLYLQFLVKKLIYIQKKIPIDKQNDKTVVNKVPLFK